MDITSFENLLLSSPGPANVVKETGPSDLVDLLRARKFSALEDLIPSLSKKDVNTISVLKALTENFNCDVADMLCEKGLDLNRIVDKKNLLVCAPTREFWDWFIDSADDNLQENVVAGAFNLLYNATPSNDPGRANSAQFALLCQKKSSKLCERVLNGLYLEEFVLNKHLENINTVQWEMLRSCVSRSTWEEILPNLEPEDIEGFKQLIYVCKQVPVLNTMYKEYFETSKKMHAWKINGLVSTTGDVKDCVLVRSLPANQRAAALKILRAQKDTINYTDYATWGVSELDMIKIGQRDPNKAHEKSKSQIQQKINQSEGYHDFFHMMMNKMGASVAKFVRQGPEVERHVLKTLDLIDCHMFAELSNVADMNYFFKRFPKTLEWTDFAGNHLGHYIAANTRNINLLLNNPALRRPNPSGICPRDLLKKSGWVDIDLTKYDEMVSKYDKTVLKDSLKEVPEVASKMRARKSSQLKM